RNAVKSRALGQLDPALYLNEDAEEHYEQGPGHVGRLWFVLRYTQDTEQLTVWVRKARNLRPRLDSTSSNSGAAGDYCIRLALENDDRRVLTTSVKRRTSNPNFDEKFCFQVPSSCLESQAIRLTALQIDRQKRQKAIGHVTFPLRELLSLDRDCRLYRDLDSEAE
uniref:C2 domain-containing protein n=1 Tax=Macrostomum lignano TaxID=282301 RepID=A0A1I8GYH1_9PLAT